MSKKNKRRNNYQNKTTSVAADFENEVNEEAAEALVEGEEAKSEAADEVEADATSEVEAGEIPENEAEMTEATEATADYTEADAEIAEPDVSEEAEVTESDSSSDAEIAESDASEEAEVAESNSNSDAEITESSVNADNEVAEDAEETEDANSETDKKATSEDGLQQTARPQRPQKPQPVKLREDSIPSKTHKERSNETAKAMEADARREARRRRRIRNQVISYVSVLVLLLIVGFGGYFIVKNIVGFGDKKPATSEVAESTTNSEEIIADLLGEEETIVEPVIEEEPVVEEPVVPAEPADALGEYVDGLIASMSLEDKVAGLFLTSPEALTGVDLATIAGAGTQAALDTYHVGGLVYEKRNFATIEQFTNLMNGTIEMLGGRKVFLAFSEEGGEANSNIAGFGFYEAAPSASSIAASYDNQQAFDAGVTIGQGISSLGFNLDLAPVADLSDTNLLRDRTYGTTAVSSSGFVKGMVEGLNSVGVTSCIKYFPGLGTTTSNPLYGRAVTDKSEEDFRSNELLVYQAAVESGYAQMIMISNVVVNAFDDSCPATLSETVVTELLRNELNYDGVILSGNLSDKAITDYYGADEAAIMALKAGCDMLQSPENLPTAYQAVLDAVNSGVISEQRVNDALERIYRVLYANNF